MGTFADYIGIDYSGANIPTTSLKACAFTWPEAMRRRSRCCRHHRPGNIGRGAASPRRLRMPSHPNMMTNTFSELARSACQIRDED